MPRHGIRAMLGLLAAVVTLITASAQQSSTTPGVHAMEELRFTSLMFVEDMDQAAKASGRRFHVRGGWGGRVWLEEKAMWITAVKSSPSSYRGCGLGEEDASSSGLGVNLKLTFVGANPQPQILPFDRLATKMSYFRGNDPASWQTTVPVWGGVRYVGLYPGLDLELGTGLSSSPGNESPIRWRLVLHPDAVPDVLSAVRLRVEGGEALQVNAEGQIEITTELGQIRQALPEVKLPGMRGFSLATWRLGQPTVSGTEIVFPYVFHPPTGKRIARENSPRDPVYSTFLGGGWSDQGCALAVDPADESVIVSGVTYSPDFPTTPGAFDPTHKGDYDAFVARLSADGSSLLYSTFLGGGSGDGSRAVAVDPRDGTIVIAGATESSDFPITPEAFDSTHSGDYDAFVARLSADGSALAYSTFLGGDDVDKGWGVALHPTDGTAIVVGRTRSSGFPTTVAAFDPTHNGNWDAFVVRLGADGGTLLYSTFLGGRGVDYGEAVAVNPTEGTGILLGGSFSADFPTTPDAFDPTHNGLGDAVVVRLEADGSGLLYSTFVGGSHHDEGHSIAVDPSDGTATIAGGTMSSDFPTTSDAFDTVFNGGFYDAFVTRLSADGSALLHSTFLGGEGDDYGAVVAVDPESGRGTVAGPTTSRGFPITPAAFDPSFNGGGSDTFVARLSADCRTLLYSTFLGGESAEWTWGLATGPTPSEGVAIVTGYTYSPDFPTTPGAFEPVYGGAGDAFVTKLVTVSPTAHIHTIFMLGRTIGVHQFILSSVRVVDQDQVYISGAIVEAVLTRPDGSSVSKSATTNGNGRAVFWVVGDIGGIWTTCVENVTATGYVYDPTQNEERCDSIVYP